MSPTELDWDEMWNTFWSMGDINRDGYIDEKDVEILEENFGWSGPPGENPADINSDGVVDQLDSSILAQNFGLIIWSYFDIHWYHVDRVTLTLNLTKEFTGEIVIIEFKGSYKEMFNVFFPAYRNNVA